MPDLAKACRAWRLTPVLMLSVPMLSVLMLGACDKAAQPPVGKAAGAQVLPGTVSDAMIDLDRSQARPLLQPPPRPRTAASDTADDSASDAAPDAAAAKPEN